MLNRLIVHPNEVVTAIIDYVMRRDKITNIQPVVHFQFDGNTVMAFVDVKIFPEKETEIEVEVLTNG